MTHTDVAAQLGRLTVELHGRFAKFPREVIAAAIRRSLHDLQGSVRDEDLPEMVARLAAWRLAHPPSAGLTAVAGPTPAKLS